MSGECESLREMARKCRSLAKGVSTPGVAESLSEMARDYDRKADKVAASALPLPGTSAPEQPAA